MADISVRQYIRWPPAPPSEPTSTVVLTSPSRHFIDVRILIHDEPGKGDVHGDSKLDWAFAGTSSSQPGQEPGTRHAVWRHWVDSHSTEPETVRDEAVVNETGGPDGSELESGRMVNPETGAEADYEEAWSSVEPLVDLGSEGRPACVVLRTWDDDRGVRGMLIRLGQFCQGILRDRDAVTVERWNWDQDGGWSLSARFGQDRLPVKALLGDMQTLKADDVVEDGTKTWKVIEVDGER